MPKVTLGGQSHECGDRTVLDTLTAQGVTIPSSCRAGICQTCLMRATKGKVPAQAQQGLKPTQIEQNYFMACACHPEEDLEVALAEDSLPKLPAVVTRITLLNADILGIQLKPMQAFSYRAGQFIKLYKDDAIVRCYSLASVPGLDDELALHIRKVPGGMMTSWLFDHLKVGDQLTISEASGECFYTAGQPAQNLLLIGTGSGLAPLYGIVRDALRSAHTGEIHLYHGSYDAAGLYLVNELRRLAARHANFHYEPCLSADVAAEDYRLGMVLDVALQDHPKLNGWKIFLCGNPDMVNAAKQETFFAGASLREIYADPF
ncbi:MAG: 2Fe-2S iron-sulfur cluster binding domain-containing protein [Nitrosomonadales bacterium]|nr:2Fe-2S iron-sulfur cluster binding domain-containing protein [Nitrosomonadales bacterium]